MIEAKAAAKETEANAMEQLSTGLFMDGMVVPAVAGGTFQRFDPSTDLTASVAAAGRAADADV